MSEPTPASEASPAHRRYRLTPLFFYALTAIAGIVISDAGWLPPTGAAVLFTLSIVFLFVGRRFDFAKLGLATGTAFALAHGLDVRSQNQFPFLSDLEKNGPRFVEVTGRLIDPPRLLRPDFLIATLEIESLRAEGTTLTSPYRLQLLTDGQTPLQYGDRVQVKGSLSLSRKARNPGGMDRRKYLRRKGVMAEIALSHPDELTVIETGLGHPVKAAALRSRNWMAAALARDLENEPEIASVIQAMVLGMREQTPDEIEDAFRFSGTLHIFAVSGLHVGMLALVLWTLLKCLGLHRNLTIWLLIPCLVFYAFVTGLRPSAVRATIMACVLIAGYAVNRQPRLVNSLGAAALLLLFLDTQQLFLPGFQLSFLVLLSIAVLSRWLLQPFQKALAPDPFIPKILLTNRQKMLHGALNQSSNLAGVSLAAWLGSLPLMIVYFNLITPVGLLANGALIPASYAILFTSILSVLASLISLNGISLLFNNANFALVHAVTGLATWFSSLPGSHFWVSTTPDFARSPCEITILDLPRGGGAQHVFHRSTGHWMVDTGHHYDLKSITLPFLRHTGVNRMEGLFLSHHDSSHIGAAPTLTEDYKPELFLPLSLADRSPARRLMENFPKRPITFLSRSDQTKPAEGFTFTALHPPEDNSFTPSQADNQSLVLRLDCLGWKILFHGDSGFSTEKQLLESSRAALECDVLIKESHATDLSGLAAFLEATAPSLVVASASHLEDDPFIQTVRQQGIALFLQKNCGAVTLRLTPGELQADSFLEESVFRKRAR